MRYSECQISGPAAKKIGSGCCSRFGPKLLTPFVAQDFHFPADLDHSRRDTLIFFDDASNGSRDRALADEALHLVIGAQAQNLFAATVSVPISESEENDVGMALISD